MHVPLGVVVADLVTIHTAWRYRKATWYVTPTAEARQTFIAAGIDPNAVHAFGLPIGRSFSQDPGYKPSLRQRLSLPPHQPIVLIVGGGSGSGPIEAAVAALSSADLAIFLVVVTGRNERLYQRLIQKTSNQTCRILRFVNDMADWMHTADVLVTKAGPATIIEAIHCGLPMVLTGALPQEQGNVAHVLSHGLGLLATTPQEITTCVCKLLTDRALSARMMAAMASLRHPQAAQQIAELILAHPEATV
jgi:1,2-diacylglycerol 3-beta-galactosyltransferase